ncbi:MAG: cell wall metabolism sensor histidine kinase WalK [Chloroflexota bacterium]|nr:cell wall metabolism sensor histidine kinase WalK [Chloroflexota bacterium]
MDERETAIEGALHLSEVRLQGALQRAETYYAQFERTKSQLRAIMDASQEAMLFLAPGGRPLKVNTRFSGFFGVDDTTVLSQTPAQLTVLLKGLFVDGEALDRWLSWSTLDREHIFREQQVQGRRERQDFDLSSLPVTNVDQTYLGRLYVWHDVTQERAVDRMKSEFVSLVSHELRTPLTSIQGYVDLLLTDEDVGTLTALQREFLGIALSNAHRLGRLINDFLDLSHIESGKLVLHCEPFPLVQLIREVSSSFHLSLAAKQQDVTLHLPDPALMVYGDANRMVQVLTNLLSNAHKYTPVGGHLEIAVEIKGTLAHISVIDTGIGLSGEEQAQLFTRFYRAENAATRAIQGTGLGLTITRSLVEMHGGELQVSSTPGVGSIFCFTLPVVK